MPLTERIHKTGCRGCSYCDLIAWNYHPVPKQKRPAWLERMQRDGLPPKDMTGKSA